MFEWDEKKNRANVKKHGVSFELAVQIFDGKCVTWKDTRKNYGENRFISIGIAKDVLVLTVAHTDRNGNTRLISARKASRKERGLYNDKIQQRPGLTNTQKHER